MKFQHPVYHSFVNNILKHEGDIFHICDDFVSVEIFFSSCKQGVPGGLFLLHLLNYSCVTWVRVALLVCKLDIMETCFFVVFNSLLSISNCIYTA